MSDSSDVPVRRLILLPALVTLAVTLVRLAGELMHGSPALFNRDAGGGAALVGIVWLIPVFGVYFALRLARDGHGPEKVGRALGWSALGFAVNLVLGAGAIATFPTNPVVQLGAFAVASWLGILVARRAWPVLWRVLLAYGFAARVPVLVIMFLAIFGGWDSHYAKPRPDFPAMGPWGLFFWTAFLPQMAVWIWMTVVVGILFGAAAVGTRRLMAGSAPQAAAKAS